MPKPDALADPTEIVVSNVKPNQVTELLYQVQERFRRLLKSLPVGVAIVQSSGTIEAVNVAMVRIFLYSEQELVGRHITDLMRKPPWSADSSLQEWYLENPGRTIELEGKSQD